MYKTARWVFFLYTEDVIDKLNSYRHHTLLSQVCPDGCHIPTIAVPGTGLRKCCVVGAQLQSAVVAVFEESLAINAQEFFCLLS